MASISIHLSIIDMNYNMNFANTIIISLTFVATVIII